MAFNQTDKPQVGELVAVMHTTKGDIFIRLFPQFAKKAVENFATHAKNGYYNGIIFHRVIKGFMIQGGDPTATGCGGESIWGKSFEDEFFKELHNIKGALCMANAGPNTNGSQFFIVEADTVDNGLLEQMKELPHMFPEETVAQYEELGGTPWLDYRHTVFGQVFDGFSVVQEIANAKVNANDKPLDDIAILSIDINEVK